MSLRGGPSGLEGSVRISPLNPTDPPNRGGKIKNAHLTPRADIDPVRRILLAEEVKAGPGEVVDMQKLPPRRARAPDDNLPGILLLRLVETAEQGRDHMRVLRVIIVARPVEIGRHGGMIEHPILGPVVLAQFQPGNLRHCIRFVGRLQWTTEKTGFRHGLGRLLRVDARTPQKEHPTHSRLVGAVDQVGGNGEVLVDELRRVGAVSDNPANLCCRNDDLVRSFPGEELKDRLLVTEIEFGPGPEQEFHLPPRRGRPDQRRPHHAPVTSNKELHVLSE